MKRRRKILVSVIVGVSSLAILSLLAYGETLYGSAQRRLPWKEDSFHGKPLSDLEAYLAKTGRNLEDIGQSSFIPGREIEPNQRVTRFHKWREYRWFPIGRALNLGYVVSEQENGREIIVEIYHGREVDSL